LKGGKKVDKEANKQILLFNKVDYDLEPDFPKVEGLRYEFILNLLE
jgi:hypothetical protein